MRAGVLTVSALAGLSGASRSRSQSQSVSQTCSTVQNPTYTARSTTFICGRQGYVSNASAIGQFTSSTSDATGCASQCISDPNCLSFAYNSKTQGCQTYSAPVRGMSFTQQSGTNSYFYASQCFIKSGDCGFSNGGFNTPPTNATVAGGTVPAGWLPWGFNTTDTSSNATAQVMTNGDNAYMQVTNAASSTSSIAQHVTLVDGTRYTLSYGASLQAINSTGSPGTLVISYGSTVLQTRDLAELDAGGTWADDGVSFTSSSGPQPLTIAVKSASGAKGNVAVGIDSLNLQQNTASTARGSGGAYRPIGASLN